MPLLKACKGILVLDEEWHVLPRLHGSFVNNEKLAKLNGLFTGDSL